MWLFSRLFSGFCASSNRNYSREGPHVQNWEHYHHAARHHERAAYQFKEAAKYDQPVEDEKAAHRAYLAHSDVNTQIQHDTEAANLHAEQCDRLATPVSKQEAEKKPAA